MTTPSPTKPQAINFAFPFRDAHGKDIVDEHLFHDWLASEGSGNFAVSGSGMWHGGIHVSVDGAGKQFDLVHGVRCIADGEVVAYLVNRTSLSSHIAAGAGAPAQTGYYSSAFTLVRHTLEYPAGNRLTFFSLYMHLQSLADYQQKAMQAPSYWARSYEVTRNATDKPKPDVHHGRASAAQSGLNIHMAAGDRTILGILPHGARVRIGERSRDGRWGRIAAIESGVLIPPRVADVVQPGAQAGWIYLGKERGHSLLTEVVSEMQCDQVVAPPTPIRINAGDLIGHLGQYWMPADPARENRMVHLEVFCDDALAGFLSRTREAADRITDFAELSLLRIDRGVKLFAGPSIDEEGANAPETAVVQIYSQAALDALPADSKGAKDDAFGHGEPWWKVTSANSRYDDIPGWVRNRQMPHGRVTRESPHAWKDFEMVTGSDAGNPTVFSSVDAWLDHALCEDKPATGEVGKLKPLACGVYRALSPMRNESHAADELRAHKDNKWLRFRASRLIPKHRSEWASRSEYLEFFEKVLTRVTKEPYHDAELERIKKLVWWDEVRKHVTQPFPSSPDVFHIHPVAMVGNFRAGCACVDVVEFCRQYKLQHATEFGWFDANNRHISIPAMNNESEKGLHDLLSEMLKQYPLYFKECRVEYLAYMLATVRIESYDWTRKLFFVPIEENISYEKAEENYGCGPTATIGHQARAIRNGNVEVGDGYKYRGRGLVQLTWKNGYKKFVDATGVDLISYPDKAMELPVAVKIMMLGMRDGKFTGTSLSDHLDGSMPDYFRARYMINGDNPAGSGHPDKAEQFKFYAEKFALLIEKSR